MPVCKGITNFVLVLLVKHCDREVVVQAITESHLEVVALVELCRQSLSTGSGGCTGDSAGGHYCLQVALHLPLMVLRVVVLVAVVVPVVV